VAEFLHESIVLRNIQPEAFDSELVFLTLHSEPMGLNCFSVATFFLFTGRFGRNFQGLLRFPGQF